MLALPAVLALENSIVLVPEPPALVMMLTLLPLMAMPALLN
jgi:hypothetical protein